VADALETLAEINGQINKLTTVIDGVRGKSVSADVVQPLASFIARSYFEFVRPDLEEAKPTAELVDAIDNLLQELLRLASAKRDKKVYTTAVDDLPQLLLEASVCIMKARGSQRIVLSETEQGFLRPYPRFCRSVPNPTSRQYWISGRETEFHGGAQQRSSERYCERLCIIWRRRQK
jgi:hypothetical protein